jgi:CRP-like cAMP-binding protein
MKSKPGSSGNISLRRGGIADGSMAGIYEPRGPRTQKSLARESQSHRRPSPKDRPPSNRILATLPPAEYERLQSYLRLVPLKRGKVLWEPNQPIDSVYFPNSGMISLVAVMANGKTVEVGMTGRHGFVGTPVLLGVQSAPFRAVVQDRGICISDSVRRAVQDPR